MAIADLLSTLFLALPGLMINIYSNYPLGEFYCQFESVFKFSSLIASQLSLITLSADRLKKVIWPFRKSLQNRTAVIICAVIWVAAILVASPMVTLRSLKRKEWKDHEEIWCWEKKGESQVYWFILLAILIYFPLLLMLAFYSAILCQMKKYEERLNESGNPVRSLRRKRIIQMIWVYLVVAFVCWTPLQVLVFYRRFVSRVSFLVHVVKCVS
jgi:preprotein translocase subunit SecE